MKELNMGMDMFLEGEIYQRNSNEDEAIKWLTSDVITLAHWRSQMDLHEYIMLEFTDESDDFQRVRLSADDMRLIIRAIGCGELPKVTGIFFDTSPNDDWHKNTIASFENAIVWLQQAAENEYRHVAYQAWC